jgi:glucosamine--fructose-6-phosphate aminotransferase (isomerizing)
MCGLVGFISKNDLLHLKVKKHFMKYALAIDTLRGEDSTGIMRLNEKGKVETKHSILPGIQYVSTNSFDKYKVDAWASFGHNRAATRGSVSRENAHPFTFGDVTLMHNGTLYGGGRSLDTYDSNLDVDSMQIALALSKSPPGS